MHKGKWRRSSTITLGFIGSFTLCGTLALAQYTASVDLNTKYQTFEGWGTSLAWWANVVGGYPDANRNNYISQFFDPVTGMGLNVVRYNIGGGENPAYLPPNGAYIQYRARVPGFEASAGHYDWTQDANQRWVLQQSMRKGVTVEEAFSNSPPYWMTNSGSATGANGSGDNLSPNYTSQFADYLTTVAKYYHDTWGVTFRTLEALNEPASGYWHFGGNQEGCGFAPATQDTMVKALASSLSQKGMSYTGVSASDETSIDTAVSTLNSFDSTAIGEIAQINTHSYGGSERSQLQAAAKATGKRLWLSEYGDGDGSGMTMAAQILKDVRNLQPAAWVYWQTVDNGDGWGFVKNGLDGSSNYSYTVNEKFYVMENFSRFIRPGYTFVGMSDGYSVAAYDGTGTVAIVTLNSGSTTQTVTYALNNFGSGPWTVTPYVTSASQNLVQGASSIVSGSSFMQTLPGASVTTFVLSNGTSSPLVSGKTYTIQNVHSGLMLEDPGFSPSTGTQMDQWSSNGGKNQEWLATAAGSNWVFTNIASGLALDVGSFSTTGGAAIDQNSVTHNTNQVWSVKPASTGYAISNSNSGQLVDVSQASLSSGAPVIQYLANNGDNQHWSFTQVN